jgi:hypothetical protein
VPTAIQYPIKAQGGKAVLAITCAALGAAARSAQAATVPAVAPAPLAYEMSAYELAPQFQPKDPPWRARDLKNAILKRVAVEKQRREMDVYYYRIGYTMAFPLSLARRPGLKELPVALPKQAYPWLIWLSWDLEERWRLLETAWRQFDDREAGALLQRELAALSGWDHFSEVDGNVGLMTGHLAGSLSFALADTSKWQKQTLREARRAANALLERDFWPWFQSHWRVENIGPNQLGNMPPTQTVTLPEGKGVRWWVFWCDPSAGWSPPSVVLRQGALELKPPGTGQAAWSVGSQ